MKNPTGTLVAGWRAAIAVVVVVFLASFVSAQIPAGAEFDISTSQGHHPSVATDAAGRFVVAWGDMDDGDSNGILARRYDAAGDALGPAFRVNTYTSGVQGNQGPRVASDSVGNFVVVWSSFGIYGAPSQDGSDSGIFGQRFSVSGTPLGTEFQVNTFTTGMQAKPVVASDALGNFVVVWWSAEEALSPKGIFAQRYDRFGAPRGSEFRVDQSTTLGNLNPSVASDPAGNVTVVWEGGLGAASRIYGRRYDNSGAPRGQEFEVSRDTAYGLIEPSVASRTDGSFVVAWSGRDADVSGVVAQRYDTSGAPLGGEFQVNTLTTGAQGGASVAADATGGFVVAWHTNGVWPDGPRANAQRYDASGAPRGTEFAVGGEFGRNSSIASDASGNFVVAFDKWGFSIAGQRFGGISPAPSRVDPQPSPNSDGNGVLEPGESVEVMPFWRNTNGAAQTFDGNGLSFSGPPAPGVSYDLQDALGVYGTVPNGTTAPCTDCYGVGVPFGGTRPATHWDATFEERLTPDTLGQTKLWPIHVGESFTDVPKTSGYYRFVETLLHKGVTGGCLPTSYCPAAPVTREQMAVFVLVAKGGVGYMAPACGATPMFTDVPVASLFCRWIEELARRGVVAGCGGGKYCPASAVSREEMSVFVLRTLDPALSPPACLPPNLFTDVPQTNPFCRWVEELANRHVVAGCGGGNYCPTGSVTREQMGVFITVTFGLALYGL
jgi:hypothetical protein